MNTLPNKTGEDEKEAKQSSWAAMFLLITLLVGAILIVLKVIGII